MPEAVQGSLAIEPAAPPVAPKAPPQAPTPVKGRYNLPAESDSEVKAPPKAPATTAPEVVQEKADQAPAAEADGEKPTEEETPEQAAKRQGRRFERKLDKAFRRAAEAEARAKLAEERLSSMSQPKAPVDEAAPRLEQFDYDPEKYAAAKAEYATKKAEKDFAEKAKTAEATKLREKLVTSWEEKAEKASDKYEDFETVVGKLTPDNPFTQAIMEAEPDLAYYLAKHPKEVERLAELPTVSARIRELGKLEAKLAAEPEKPKKPSTAPAPIKPLSGAGSTKSDVPSEDDSTADWIRKRQKQVHRQR